MLFLVAECLKDDPPGVSGPADPGTSGPGVLTASPLALPDLVFATLLQNLYPPDHTFPTNHVHFCYADPGNRHPGDMDSMRTVYAPGNGILTNIDLPSPPDNENAIDVKMAATFSCFLGHIILAPGLRVGDRLMAGRAIGTTGKVSFAVDFEVINSEVTLSGFSRRNRYPFKTLHEVVPYGYYARPQRDSLYARVKRKGTDMEGKIDYDIPGKLSGKWFLEGLPTGQASFTAAACTKHLSFVYDMTDPSAIRIGIGGTLTITGLYGVDASSPEPHRTKPGILGTVWRVRVFLVSPFGGSTRQVDNHRPAR